MKINFCCWFGKSELISLSSKNINIGGRRSRSCLPICQTAWPSFAKVTNFHQITISIFHFSSNLAQSDQVLPDYSNTNFSCLKEVSNYAAWTTFTFQWVQSFTIITELSPKAQNAISTFQEVLNEKTLYIVIENSQKKKVCNARFFDNSALKTKHFFSDKSPQLSKGKVFLISIFWLRGTSLWII